MRTSRMKKMAADAAALRRESPASRTFCSIIGNFVPYDAKLYGERVGNMLYKKEGWE